MILKNNGNVGIGTSNPAAKLALNGIAKANEVKVTTASEDWPDYSKEDISPGEMNARLLEKIEELTFI